MYESEFDVMDEYMQDNDVEYAVVRPGGQSQKAKVMGSGKMIF